MNDKSVYGLAVAEEKDMLAQFGAEYAGYRQRTPAFIPTFSKERSSA